MIPASSVMLPISNPRHPLYHGDCACCCEHYDKPIPSPAKFALEEVAQKAMVRVHGPRYVPRLQTLREGQFLSQERLASIAGISVRQVVNLEEGRNRARGLTATKLAAALGVEVEDLESTS